jgi:hypothetical protein
MSFARNLPIFVAVFLAVFLAACATTSDPVPLETVGFLERSVTQEERGVTVSAAVPDSEETRDLFGIALYKKDVQPVWLSIRNDTDRRLIYMPAGTDVDYHSPFEVAAYNRNANARARLEQYFFRNGVALLIDPGETRSGFIFTGLDEGTKSFNVDIVADEDNWKFTFFIQVPGLAIDHHDVDFRALYAQDEITHFTDAEAFIEALENLPCCTVDNDGENQGDPLNLVLIGEPMDIYYAILRAAWDETEVVTAESGWKTAMSFLTGGEYRYSPVSSLYLFGRSQDVALQKIRDNIHERNHFRIWLAPMTFNGQSVWIGQISRDIGVRFTRKTITTHKIDPDVDETREYLVENLAYNQVIAKIAYVGGVGAASIDEPRSNLTGDPYYTDGLRVVLWFSRDPVDLDNIEFVRWRIPTR